MSDTYPLTAFPRGAVRQASIAPLVAARERQEQLGGARVAAVADAIERSPRTVYRNVLAGGYIRTERERFRIEDEELTVLAMTRMNRRKAHELLEKNLWADGTGPSYSQFARAIKRDVHPALLAALKKGDRAARRYLLSLILTHDRPYEVVSVDGKQMSVFVQHPTKLDPDDPSKPLLVQPWVLWAKDGHTKGITAVVASPDALNHHHVLDVIRATVWGDSELGPFRGRPLAVAWDRGALNTADAVTAALSALAIPVWLSDAYQPHQNGLIESFNAFAESDFAASDPFYAHPPIGIDGRPFLPDPEYAPTFAQFEEKLRAWVSAYNHRWRHSSNLHRRTAIQAWEAADEKPEPVPDEWERLLRLDSRYLLVTAKGVEVDGDHFTCEELDSLMDDHVDVRVRDDRRTVEVFNAHSGDWIGTAVNQRYLTPHQKMEVLATRTGHHRQARHVHRRAISYQEAALRAQRENARETHAKEAADDAAAVATARVGRPQGAINQPVQLPENGSRGRVKRDP